MKSEVADFFSEHVPQLVEALEQIRSRIPADAPPDCDDLLDELTTCMNGSLHACAALEMQLQDSDPVALKDLQARYRAAIAPVLNDSWVFNRSFTKPRGYPGDYQLLTAIYNGVPKSLGFGGYFDRYLLNFTLARAVVARMWSARRFLMDELARRRGRVAILNVASGACREYLGGFEPATDREAQITCVDNDQEALDFAQSQVTSPLSRSGISVNFIRHNALRMTSASSNVRRFGLSDVIYSVGLCDYIPDEYLIPLLAGWRQSLADGGIVYVAFKDCLLYDKTEYQWLMDWYFFQRTEQDCRKLFLAAGFEPSEIETSRDATGVIINFLCRSTTTEIVRVDNPQERPLARHLEGAPVSSPGSIVNHN
jgi:extracellular factor (EF) 3-hydroxypalmitic acid methyl ester biosynthesis protein